VLFLRVLNGKAKIIAGRLIWPASFYICAGLGACPVITSVGPPDGLLAMYANRRAMSCSRRKHIPDIETMLSSYYNQVNKLEFS
jgi:hypothetical protein